MTKEIKFNQKKRLFKEFDYLIRHLISIKNKSKDCSKITIPQDLFVLTMGEGYDEETLNNFKKNINKKIGTFYGIDLYLTKDVELKFE